jgi:ubiquitin
MLFVSEQLKTPVTDLCIKYGKKVVDGCGNSMLQYYMIDMKHWTVKRKIVHPNIYFDDERVFCTNGFNPFDTLKKFKTSIASLLCLDKMTMYHNGVELEEHVDELRISDLKINSSSRIELTIPAPDTDIVTLECLNRTFQVNRNDDITSIKRLIMGDKNYNEFGHNYVLGFIGKCLVNGKLESHIKNRKYVKLDLCNEYKLFMKTMDGKIITVRVSPFETIETLKLKVQEEDGVPPEQQRLIFCGKVLADHVRVIDYNIANGSTLHIALQLRGGGTSLNFVDVTKIGALVDRNWSDDAPIWRVITKHGFCVEGKCRNNNCEAYNHDVICSLGTGEFDMQLSTNLMECPLCKTTITPENCGFNNCRWKYHATKVGDPTIIKSDVFVSGDSYTTFNETESGKAEFGKLKFYVKTRNTCFDDKSCEFCGFGHGNADYMADCGHQFHKNCLDGWLGLSIPGPSKCLLCRYSIDVGIGN